MTDHGDGERWIVIARWDEFQHRDMARSRVPPWIKNWTRLLNDQAYLDLTPHQRAVLHGLWLLYASTRRQVPVNTASLTRQLALRVSSRQLEALNHAGFIHFSASNPASRVAGLEVERERAKSKSLQEPLTTPRANRENGTPTTLANITAAELKRLAGLQEHQHQKNETLDEE